MGSTETRNGSQDKHTNEYIWLTRQFRMAALGFVSDRGSTLGLVSFILLHRRDRKRTFSVNFDDDR